MLLPGAGGSPGRGGGGAATRGPNPRPASIDRSLKQKPRNQQIKPATTRVGDQLDAILAEFERNGIGGEGGKALKALPALLGEITAQEMEKNIPFLQEARGANHPPPPAHPPAHAYARQKPTITPPPP